MNKGDPIPEERNMTKTQWLALAAAHLSLLRHSGIQIDQETFRASQQAENDILATAYHGGTSGRINDENLAKLGAAYKHSVTVNDEISVKPVGGRHWDVTDPAGRTARVTTDPEAYQRADGRLQWWSGPRQSSDNNHVEPSHHHVP